jgi:hypothetical protein
MKKNLEVDEKISRSVNTAVSVSLLFHPVYGFFLTLKHLKKTHKKKELLKWMKNLKDFLKKTAVSVSLSFFIQYTDSVLEQENEK